MKEKTKIAVALGSNLGNRMELLQQAAAQLSEDLFEGAKFSQVYENPPQNKGEDPLYLNAVAVGETDWKPPAILNLLKNIERELGRAYSVERNTSRFMDLDLLAYGELKWEGDGVIVPHPRMRDRAFVLLPLSELWPQWRDPVTGNTCEELLHRLAKSELSVTIPVGPLLLDKANPQ